MMNDKYGDQTLGIADPKFTSITLQGKGEGDSVAPTCPNCREELRAEGSTERFVITCGCDNPPKRFVIPGPDGDGDE